MAGDARPHWRMKGVGVAVAAGRVVGVRVGVRVGVGVIVGVAVGGRGVGVRDGVGLGPGVAAPGDGGAADPAAAGVGVPAGVTVPVGVLEGVGVGVGCGELGRSSTSCGSTGVPRYLSSKWKCVALGSERPTTVTGVTRAPACTRSSPRNPRTTVQSPHWMETYWPYASLEPAASTVPVQTARRDTGALPPRRISTPPCTSPSRRGAPKRSSVTTQSVIGRAKPEGRGGASRTPGAATAPSVEFQEPGKVSSGPASTAPLETGVVLRPAREVGSSCGSPRPPSPPPPPQAAAKTPATARASDANPRTGREEGLPGTSPSSASAAQPATGRNRK